MPFDPNTYTGPSPEYQRQQQPQSGPPPDTFDPKTYIGPTPGAIQPGFEGQTAEMKGTVPVTPGALDQVSEGVTSALAGVPTAAANLMPAWVKHYVATSVPKSVRRFGQATERAATEKMTTPLEKTARTGTRFAGGTLASILAGGATLPALAAGFAEGASSDPEHPYEGGTVGALVNKFAPMAAPKSTRMIFGNHPLLLPFLAGGLGYEMEGGPHRGGGIGGIAKEAIPYLASYYGMYKLDQLATLLTKAGLAATPGGLAALAGQIASDPTVRATAKAAIQKVVPISDSGWDWLTSGNNGGQQQQQ